MKPYIDDKLSDNQWIRTFDHSVDNEELIWHRDNAKRKVEILEGAGWFLQFDDCLPFELLKNRVYVINKDQYHRLLKLNEATKLKIIITELYD